MMLLPRWGDNPNIQTAVSDSIHRDEVDTSPSAQDGGPEGKAEECFCRWMKPLAPSAEEYKTERGRGKMQRK
jgi:hypothetical protein